ncbi:dihydrolipoyl dehydrogenase family protein [Microbacterium telephonicum]|uniref:Dihydrolipoamide dehydrogenase n=1 Tax=Microbacterium telephonicum TaxID=1714841 RepID=A0A498CBD2_9MICO|nr:NAD(P)/FAD-dependent oxidoreductase [Microbacterium telephonicum]RLK52952.1 dihydrolipoamide dehydrogenase [Microbacterium telephonicum]
MDTAEYDLIVIGAGPVGENVADRAVKGGLTAVIVESELVGGECSYWACMPSKVLLRAGAARTAAADAPGTGVTTSGGVDVAAVLRRRDEIVHEWDDSGQVGWLQSAGIDLVRGHGRITGEREVTVADADGSESVLRARHAVAVCTGSAALHPDIEGLRDAAPWTSREATAVQEVPASLVVLGGGVVACEMATAYASFGCRVSIIARSRLLGGMEDFAGDAVATALREAGVDVRLGTDAVRVHRLGSGGDGGVAVTLGDGDVIEAAEILVATGRVPRTGHIGLESVDLEPGTWLDVDDTLRVRGTEWLYAVGDVNHRALLTHQGKYQARAAGDVIAARATGAAVDDAPWGTHVATADHDAVPQVTFTDPQVASVGLTEAAAARRGLEVRVLDIDLAGIAGASTQSADYRGRARAVVDPARDVLVGATFVGPEIAELLHSATVAIVGEVPLARLWHAVPSYPTLSEVWLRWLEAYGRPS